MEKLDLSKLDLTDVTFLSENFPVIIEKIGKYIAECKEQKTDKILIQLGDKEYDLNDKELWKGIFEDCEY